MILPFVLRPSARVTAVCLMALAIGFGMAVISLAKAVLFGTGLVLLLAAAARGPATASRLPAGLWTPAAVVLALAGMALTLLWTPVPLDDALKTFVKHAKLIMIPLLIWLLRSRQEARLALGCFALGQLFTLLSSWMLILGLPVPWASSGSAQAGYSIFAGRLSQPIMTSIFAALCWHLRGEIPGRYGRVAAAGVVVLALAYLLLFSIGRTGQVVGVGLLSLAVVWQLPRRYRLASFVVPFAVALVSFTGASAQVRERLYMVAWEAREYVHQSQNQAAAEIQTSSGQRLEFWSSSLQAAVERPLLGYGVGSWNLEYNRLKGRGGHPSVDTPRNPHQEFLLWLVEGGAVGLLLLLGVIVALLRDSARLPRQSSRAALSVVAALVLASLFNSALFDGAIGDYFCVVMALTLALGLREREQHAA